MTDGSAIAALVIEIRWLTDGIEMMREQRRRSVARLLEIAGLGDDIGAACSQMYGIKVAAADVNHHGARLRAELTDLADQMKGHREQLQAVAGARPNGSSTLQEQSAKLRAAAAGKADDKPKDEAAKQEAETDKQLGETVKLPDPPAQPLPGTAAIVGQEPKNPF